MLNKSVEREIFKNIQQCINCISSITDEWASDNPCESFTAFMIGEISVRLDFMKEVISKELDI